MRQIFCNQKLENFKNYVRIFVVYAYLLAFSSFGSGSSGSIIYVLTKF